MINIPTKEPVVLCLLDDSTAIAYFNVYEEGDAWIKIKGCESCSLENRKRCCNGCPMFTEKGCFFHLDNLLNKPYRCVAKPTVNICLSWCSLEFKCIEGSKLGKIRRVRKPGDIFDDE